MRHILVMDDGTSLTGYIDNKLDILRKKMQRRQFWVSLSKFSIPFAIATAYLLFIYLFLNWETLYPLVATYFFPPLGKESVIPAGVAAGITPIIMASAIICVDMIVGLFMVWNFDLAKKIPAIGAYLRSAEKGGRRVLSKNEWMRKFAIVGVSFIVFIPFQGSGAVTASIIGRIIGMRPYRVLLALAIGSVLSSFAISYFMDSVLKIFILNRWIAVALFIIVILIVSILYRKYWS